jgi:hypothetical protein
MGSFAPLAILVLLGCAFSTTMAADCIVDTQNFILTTDIMNGINAVATNNFNPPLADSIELKAQHTQTLTFPGTVFCISNQFLFENTHITLSDISFGATDIVNQCCSGPNCQGGRFTITGDSGLTVILKIQPGGTAC